MMRISIQPKRARIRIICGMNSKMKSSGLLKWSAFKPFMMIPMDIWRIAKITEIFILRLLV